MFGEASILKSVPQNRGSLEKAICMDDPSYQWYMQGMRVIRLYGRRKASLGRKGLNW